MSEERRAAHVIPNRTQLTAWFNARNSEPFLPVLIPIILSYVAFDGFDSEYCGTGLGISSDQMTLQDATIGWGKWAIVLGRCPLSAMPNKAAVTASGGRRVLYWNVTLASAESICIGIATRAQPLVPSSWKCGRTAVMLHANGYVTMADPALAAEHVSYTSDIGRGVIVSKKWDSRRDGQSFHFPRPGGTIGCCVDLDARTIEWTSADSLPLCGSQPLSLDAALKANRAASNHTTDLSSLFDDWYVAVGVYSAKGTIGTIDFEAPLPACLSK